MQMGKLMILLGFTFLFSGVFISSYSNVFVQESRIEWTDVAAKEEAWTISNTFNEGDLIRVGVYPALDWGDKLFPAENWPGGVPYPNRPVWVNVTDPLGAETEFFCDYAAPFGTSTLYLYNVTITENNGLLVGADASLEGEMRARPRVMGKAASTGEYTAYVFGVPSPASSLILQTGEKLEWIDYPYSNLIYLGIALILVSVVLLFFGFKKPKRKSRVQKKRT